MDKLVITNDISLAAEIWQRADLSPDCQMHFEQFLGIDLKGISRHNVWTTLISPEGFERLQLLLNGNGHAVVKIHLANLPQK